MARQTKTRSRGFFISFEGGEGSGKTTQMRHLLYWLRNQGLPVEETREPGGTLIGNQIRAILLSKDNARLAPRAELLLYLADRAQHADEVLAPALAQGKIIVSDRFADSSTVYQGICRGLGLNWTVKLNDFASSGLWSDLVILLDVPERVGLARARRRGNIDRLEAETVQFHRKVRNGFLKLARLKPSRFAIIDATQTEIEVAARIQKVVSDKLKRRKLWTPPVK